MIYQMSNHLCIIKENRMHNEKHKRTHSEVTTSYEQDIIYMFMQPFIHAVSVNLHLFLIRVMGTLEPIPAFTS